MWEMIDLAGGTITIPAELRKGKRRDRIYRAGPETIAALCAIREPARDLVFPWPYDRSYLWPKYRVILRRAGLPTDRKSMFHRVRKSVASHGAAAGADPVALMDHSDSRVTRAYLDVRITGQVSPVDVLFRPGSG